MSEIKLSYNNLQEIYADRFLGHVLTLKKDRKYVWHVALPKSGTTWLSSILGHLFEMRGISTASLVPDYSQRPQEIDPRYFITPETNDVFFRQQHCLHSSYTEKLVRLTNTKIIFQYRNLEDALTSLADHYHDALFGTMAEKDSLVKGLWNLKETELNDFIIDVKLPWYCEFLSGWLTSDIVSSNIFYKLNYDDLKASPFDTISHLSDALSLGFSKKEIEDGIGKASSDFTRLNKGVTGRGACNFTDKQRDKIRRCMSYYGLPTELSNSKSC